MATAPRTKPAPRINPHRGETLWNGLKLCLTVNALVEIEEGLGVPLSQIGVRMAEPKMADLRLILAALARGGGATMEERDDDASEATGRDIFRTVPISDLEVGKKLANIQDATTAIEEAFIAAGVFKPSKPGEAPAPGN